MLYRHGEKKILLYLMSMSKRLLPLLDMDFKTARKTANAFPDYESVRDYINNVILYLIKKA